MNLLTYLKNLLLGNGNDNKTDTQDYNKKLDELKDYVDAQYKNVLPEKQQTPDVPTYEPYEYKAPTDEEIQNAAKSEFEQYARDNENSIAEQYRQKENELNADKSSQAKAYENSRKELLAAYDKTAEMLSNDALKRGLARSSIALNSQAEAGKAYQSGAQKLVEQYNDRISEIDDELNGLSGKLQSALDSFKIALAAKITARINELKGEREEKKKEALEYNNKLLKDEYESKLKKAEADSKLYSDSLSQSKSEKDLKDSLSPEAKVQLEKNIYDKVCEVLDSMPFEQAREAFLNNPIFRNSLSDYYYYTLLYKYR